MTAISLHIGLNAVDPDSYGGWDGRLEGCENDAWAMARIATSCGYTATVITSTDATSARVLGRLSDAAQTLRAGDSFLLTIASHGAQLPDPDGDDPDGSDEAIALHDRFLLDDEVNDVLATFALGVRLVVIGDLCHSGDVLRRRDRPRAVPASVVTSLVGRLPRRTGVRSVGARSSDVLLLAACAADESTGDGPVNGAFTTALVAAWNGGDFAGSYHDLRKQIDALLPAQQNPTLLARTAAAAAMADERPFRTTPPLTEKENLMSVTTLPPTEPGQAPAIPAAPAPATTSLPDGMPPELAFRLDRSRLLEPLAGIEGPTAMQTISELSGARPASAIRGSRGGFAFHWWGMNLKLSHEELETVLTSVNATDALARVVGGVIPGQARGYIELVSTFIQASATALRAVDQGLGVYISMSWVAPGLFVPTPIRPGDRSGPRSGTLVHDDLAVSVGRLDGDVDSGVILQTGQRIVVSASGLVWSGIFATGDNGPEGWANWTASIDAPDPGSAPFCLLARIDGRPRYIGRGQQWIHAGPPARLYLLVNDHRRIGNGAFRVQVDVYSS